MHVIGTLRGRSRMATLRTNHRGTETQRHEDCRPQAGRKSFAASSLCLCASVVSLLLFASGAAWAQTRIEFFFPVPVEGKLAREMTRLVKQYNDSQKEVEVTAVYTGSYDETKLKAQAAAKAGKPPSVVLMSANF